VSVLQRTGTNYIVVIRLTPDRLIPGAMSVLQPTTSGGMLAKITVTGKCH